jgi:molybdopterin/thiamine biosynthesis adenylyltransferase
MSNSFKHSNNENFYIERTQRNHFFLGGEEGQLKLRKLKVGVAGLGGMGSNIAEYLARVGVGELRLADPDTIDTSNINRQVIANTKSVGKKKAIASKEEINIITPDVDIKVYEQGITEDIVEEFVIGCDFIVDEIDIFPLDAHYTLHKMCRKHNVPVYSAYVIGLGVHFYKFYGDEFKFEDFLSFTDAMTDGDVLEEVSRNVVNPAPQYLQGENLADFKKMALNKGVPIFGPSCLVGHSIVVTRILCDFLGSEILGMKIPKTPVMPNFVKIDFSTLEISIEKFSKKL